MENISQYFTNTQLSLRLGLNKTEVFSFEKTFKDSDVLVGSIKNSKSERYAIKVYPIHEDMPHIAFETEARFSDLKHKNVIAQHQVIPSYQQIVKGKKFNCSIIIMELGQETLYDLHLKMKFTAKLARTLFQHLVDGLSYLHTKGVAHLDLKPDNILVGKDFRLKIADFDLSFRKGDRHVQSRGSENFRAPELLFEDCKDPFAADIYSLGILLFVLKFGSLPCSEIVADNNIDYMNLMFNDLPAFWKAHETRRGKNISIRFKKLFESMVTVDPSKRATLNEIRSNSWVAKTKLTTKDIEKCLSANQLKKQ